MSERGEVMRERLEMVLRPRIGAPLGLCFFAVFLAYIGWVALQAGGLQQAWWAAGVAWLLAGFAPTGAVKLFRSRSLLVLRLTPERLSFGDVSIRRFQITSVRSF